MTYDHDLVIDRGRIRKKTASRKFHAAYGHTPLSAAEDIPWQCRGLVVGNGAAGALPVMRQVRDEARRRKVDLVILPTAEAIRALAKDTKDTKDTNAILHLTCRTCRGSPALPQRLRSLVRPIRLVTASGCNSDRVHDQVDTDHRTITGSADGGA